MKTIAIAGTFDTKGDEFLYAKHLVEKLGFHPLMIHTGAFEPKFVPDISNSQVAAAIGENMEEIAAQKDRARATAVLSKGMEALIPQLYQEGKLDAILSFGGSGGTALVTPAMRALPIGVPKLMVSTMASGNVAQYVGTSDIVMMPSIVDVAGLNKISKTIFNNAVYAIAGMVKGQAIMKDEKEEHRPLIAASMFGVTTPCVMKAKEYLEKQGFEVVVFHMTGTGGKTMESLIKQGFFAGVLDLTTTEWCDEVAGGVLSAGTHRCEAAATCGVPQVVSVGACDMVNFGPPDTVPKEYASRKFYQHNPMVTLMRTSEMECREVARNLAKRWNQATSDMTVLLPEKGVSMIDADGKPFDGPVERKVLFDTIKSGIDNPHVKIHEVNLHINDPEFAQMAAKELVTLIQEKESTRL
jgi:uncharacterized protein (UPF0261 family)